MTADQFTELIKLLSRNLYAIEQRCDTIERRLSALEVSQEDKRHDTRALEERPTSVGPTRDSEGGRDLRPGRDPMMSPAQHDCLMVYLNWWFDRLERRPGAGESAEGAAAMARIQSRAESARRRLEASGHLE
jgi:hypothetical protein